VKFLAILGLAAGCSFHPSAMSFTADGSPPPSIDAPGSGSGSAVDASIDAPDASPCWSWTTTNFDSCALPQPPVPLSVSGAMTISTDAPPSNWPSTVLTQSDGSHILVVHLSSLDVSGILVINGSMPIVLAVDGTATINGPIATTAGANNPAQCGTRTGVAGRSSNVADTGGGGGGGGAGADDGGDGTDGTNGNHANGNGTHGGHGTHVASTLSPLIAGCAGGAGGTSNGAGTAGTGGAGGGALQISAQASITVSSTVTAAGLNQSGGTTAQQTGGGGGGGGGAVFLESGSITISAGSHVCADGGAGSEGGGSSNPGAAGGTSPCSGTAGATTTAFNMLGGTGGNGGFRATTKGGNAGPASNDSTGGHGAGGGGGGGGVGWIRMRGVTSAPAISGTVSPAPSTM
jgi:hypothetical protein